MIPTDREAAKDRVRAKIAARKAMTARDYLYDLLCATNTHADAEAILDRFERETPTAQRLNAVMDICDEAVRVGITSGGPFTVRRVHRAALGDPA